MNRTTTTLALVALAASAALLSAPAGASKPSTPEQMRDLAQLKGRWSGPVSMEMGGQTSDGKASLDCRVTSGGFAVLCDTTFTIGGNVQRETDLFGYDPHTGRHHWFAVNSGGDTHDHVATRIDGGHSEWRYEGDVDGKKLVETIAMTISAGGREARFQSTVTVGGQRAAQLSGTIQRRGR